MCVILQVEDGHVKLDLLAWRSRYSPLAVPEKVIESFPWTPGGFNKQRLPIMGIRVRESWRLESSTDSVEISFVILL